MGAILDAVRSSRWLQIGVPAAVLVVIAVVVLAATGVIGGLGNASGSGNENLQLVTVRLDNLETEIPVDGRLGFPKSESLTFDARGIVGDISVEVGQTVAAGQVLASFDGLAIADLQTGIAEERINVQNAQNILNVLKISTPVSVAQAETLAANAEVRLDDVREALEDLVDPEPFVVSQAEQALADADKAFDDAQEALDDLLNPEEFAVSDAENRVANAKVEIDAAQEAFDDIKDGAFPIEEIRDAQNALDFANTQLTNSQRTLSEVKLDWENRIRRVQKVFDEESENYRDIYKNWLGIELTEEEIQKDPDTLFQEWGVDLDVLFDRKNPLYISRTPTKDDPDTRWTEFRIWAWLNLYPSPDSIQGTCGDNELVVRNCVSREFDDIFDIYDDARDNLQNTKDMAANAIDTAEDGVTDAEDAVADAQENFDEVVLQGPDLSKIEAAETRLARASAALKEAQEDLDELLNPDPLDVAQKEKALDVARAAVEEAREDLDDLLNPDRIDVSNLEKEVALAEANLAEARVNVESARRSHELAVELAQANVNLAQEGVNEAIDDLEGGFIKAPFDGVISLINVEMDDEVNDESRILDIVDPSVVEVDGVVDAANIGSVRQGSPARVTFQGIGGAVLNGTVTFVASEPITENGVVSFPVTVRADVPAGVNIPVGLNAVNTVVLGEAAGALLVPREAVENGANGPIVRVMNGDGLLEERRVSLGAVKDTWIVIRSGLSEGDQVVAGSSGGGQS